MILVLVPVVIELVFLGAVGQRLYDATKEYEHLQRSRHALLQLHHFEKIAEDALLALAKEDDSSAAERIEDVEQLIQALRIPWTNANSAEHPELNAIIQDSEEARLKLIEVLSQIKLRLYKHLGRTVRPGQLVPKNSTISMFMEVRPLSKRIIEIETDMLNSDAGQIENLTWKLGILLGGGAIIGFLISLWLVRDFTSVFLNRLGVVANKAILLSGGKDLPPPLDGNDELAELDQVLIQAHRELKNARQKQFAILDNARDILCTLDSRLRITTTGDAVAKVWLYSADDLLGLSLISIIAEPLQEFTRTTLNNLAETGGECEFENQVKRKDGSLKTFLWKVSYSKEQANFFCVAHDISESKAAQELKQQFLTTASEELRTPLNLASSLINSLAEDTSNSIPTTARDEVAKANYNLTRLTDLVAELLDLEALKSIERDIEMLPVSALEICRQATHTLDALAVSRSIEIVPPTTDATIIGDKRRLVQAVVNYLSNAIKFSPRNSRISLTVETNPKLVTISVCDQGPGVPPSKQDSLFTKFRQAGTESTADIKGTGLGLALVKSVAEAHGGTAGYAPQNGGGSRFFITLPASTEGNEA